MASTFAIHADRLDVVAAAEMAGVDRATVLDTIERLDAAVAEIDGHGFAPTPFGRRQDLIACCRNAALAPLTQQPRGL